jgi:hypothetical protein
MSESYFAGEPLPMLGAAALLGMCDMRYADDQNAIRFFDANVAGQCLAIPKDHCSDHYRFDEALQEKIAEVCGDDPIFGVLPVPLGSRRPGSNPHQWMRFHEEWQKREVMRTTKLWGDCFQSMPWIHKQRGAFVELDISGEHYYNVVVFPNDIDNFKAKNPEFVMRQCRLQCFTSARGETVKGRHVHFVHGAYKGSWVAGIDCAPPFRLAKFWRHAFAFRMKSLIRDYLPHKDGASQVERYSVFGRIMTWGYGHGALVLAKMATERGGADLKKAFDVFQDQRAAAWASFIAYHKDEKGLNRMEKVSQGHLEDVLDMDWARRPFHDILLHIWNLDHTNAKVLALNVLWKYMHRDQVRNRICEESGPSP